MGIKLTSESGSDFTLEIWKISQNKTGNILKKLPVLIHIWACPLSDFYKEGEPNTPPLPFGV